MAGPGARLLNPLPALPGSYALHLLLAEPITLAIGRLGSFTFPTGSYLYFGSAHGPGGLRARIGHHARFATRPRWHLDYLRPHVQLAGGWYSTAPGPLECCWSQWMRDLPGAFLPAAGFGAGDCRRGCPAHLVGFPALSPQRLTGMRTACTPGGAHPDGFFGYNQVTLVWEEGI